MQARAKESAELKPEESANPRDLALDTKVMSEEDRMTAEIDRQIEEALKSNNSSTPASAGDSRPTQPQEIMSIPRGLTEAAANVRLPRAPGVPSFDLSGPLKSPVIQADSSDAVPEIEVLAEGGVDDLDAETKVELLGSDDVDFSDVLGLVPDSIQEGVPRVNSGAITVPPPAAVLDHFVNQTVERATLPIEFTVDQMHAFQESPEYTAYITAMKLWENDQDTGNYYTKPSDIEYFSKFLKRTAVDKK